MAEALLEEVAINPTIELPELKTELGKSFLEGTNRTLCTRTQKKGAGPHGRLTQTCLGVPRSLQQRRGSAVACCRVGGTECTVHAWDL